MAAPSSTALCRCITCVHVRLTIDEIFRVLELYGWLLDSYVVDFFQENLWQRLPQSWRDTFHDISPQEVGTWLSGDISCKRVWPLSLLALQQVLQNLQICRDHKNAKSIWACSRSASEISKDSEPLADNVFITNHLEGKYSKFKNLFTKHVKSKKRYEIDTIAKVCADCAEQSNCKCIVDIGAGMGHLARVLAFQYGLCVACIEQEQALSQQASKCDKEFLMSIMKHVPDFSNRSPQHVSAKLESSNLIESELIEQLGDVFKLNFDISENKTEFGLVGLHPCGDLAPLLLKLYASREEAKFICIVGCCYMKLTLESEKSEDKGYPLSEYLKDSNHQILSYAVLEVACHAIEKFSDKLMAGNYEDLIVHAYRAALETILIKKSVKLRRCQLKNVKVTGNMSFEQYSITATSNLEPDLQPSNSDICNPQIKEFLKQWKRVLIFASLRIMLAPLIETIVLFDRFLYLSEKNYSPILKPIFDAKLSPRNFVLISIKKPQYL